MTKEEIYNQYFLIPSYDDTKERLREVYLSSEQKGSEALIKACETMSQYVSFCMNRCDYYWSEKHQKYIQIGLTKDVELDWSKWKVELFLHGLTIYPDTDLSTVPYPNIKEMMQLRELSMGYPSLFKFLLESK